MGCDLLHAFRSSFLLQQNPAQPFQGLKWSHAFVISENFIFSADMLMNNVIFHSSWNFAVNVQRLWRWNYCYYWLHFIFNLQDCEAPSLPSREGLCCGSWTTATLILIQSLACAVSQVHYQVQTHSAEERNSRYAACSTIGATSHPFAALWVGGGWVQTQQQWVCAQNYKHSF